MTQLSKNFTLSEFEYSDTADANNIDNTVPVFMIPLLKHLCQHFLQPLRDHINAPIKITSGYRCPKLNTLTKGVPTSHHQLGIAADFVCSTHSPRELFDIVRTLQLSPSHYPHKLPYDELIKEPNWVHVSLFPINQNMPSIMQ